MLSQKGGTGKTTTVRTLADVLRRSGVRTLAVDLDPQGNLSDYFDLPPDAEPTIADVLAGRDAAAEAIHDDVIPANLALAEAELMLGGKMGRELTLRRALADVREEYEIVLIDCPPSLGLLTVNALVAADRALITAEAQYFALQGVEQAMEVIELARDSLNPELSLLGVLLNLADMRTVHSREALASLQERFGEKVFDTVIRASIAYAESAERATSILDHRPDLGAGLPGAGERSARAPAGLATAPRRRVRELRSELVDVGALRLERRPQQRRPALDLAAERLGDGAGLLVEAPHEHGRPGAGDRRPERAQLARAHGQLERAREQRARAAAGAGGPAGRARRRSQSPRASPSVSSGGVGDVEHGLLHRHLARAAPRARRACAPPRSGTTASASRPVGGSKRAACPSAQMTKPPCSAAATLSGWPSSSVASASRSASSSNMWSAAIRPATIAAALEPSPPESGISERIRNVKPSAGCRRSNAAHAQVLAAARDRQLGLDRERARLHHLELQVQRRRAAAMQSKPGPRFAEEAGTRTTAPTDHPAPPPRAPAALGDDTWMISAVVVGDRGLGVLQAAAGEHAHDLARRRRRRT